MTISYLSRRRIPAFLPFGVKASRGYTSDSQVQNDVHKVSNHHIFPEKLDLSKLQQFIPNFLRPFKPIIGNHVPNQLLVTDKVVRCAPTAFAHSSPACLQLPSPLSPPAIVPAGSDVHRGRSTGLIAPRPSSLPRRPTTSGRSESLRVPASRTSQEQNLVLHSRRADPRDYPPIPLPLPPGRSAAGPLPHFLAPPPHPPT